MDVPALIKAAVQHDLAAQEQLFKRYYERTWRLCVKAVKDRDEAEELLLVTYEALFDTLSKFRYAGKGSLFKWIGGIVFIKRKEYNRKKFRWTSIEEDMAIDENPEHQLSARIDHYNLVEIVYRQKDNVYVMVFIMNVLWDMDHTAISTRLNMAPAMSRKYLMRGRKYLFELLTNRK